MSDCPHDLAERETAVADGYCPLCMEAENERLRAEKWDLQSALAVMWHAYDTDNRPPHWIVKFARECHDANRRVLERRKK